MLAGAVLVENEAFDGVRDESGAHDEVSAEVRWVGVAVGGCAGAAEEPCCVGGEVA